MSDNLTRKFEKIVKPVVLIGLLLLISFCGLSREAQAATHVEVGAAIASGEYTEGQALLLTETFDKYSIGIGYITEQDIEDRSGAVSYARPNLYLQGYRNIRITDKFYTQIGVAYFNSTNRALGSNWTATLAVQWRFSDRMSVQLRHYSNAGSASPNMGQDLLTVGYTF